MTDQTLRALSQEYWDTLLEASPSVATLLGDHRFDDRIEDVSVDAEHRLRGRWSSILERLAAIDRVTLTSGDQVTYGQLALEAGDAIAGIDQGVVELQSDQMTGLHVALLQSVPIMSAPDAASAGMLLQRFRQIPDALATAAGRFLDGAAAGRTPAAVCVNRSVRVIEGYLATPLDSDLFAHLAGPPGWEGEAGWRSALRDLARDVIRPAYRQLADTLAERLLPRARDDDHCGLSWLRDGAGIYRTLARHHTTLDLDPAEIHQIGMEEVTERLPREYAEAGGRYFGVSELTEVFARLRNDPAIRYRAADEIMNDALRALAAARSAMPDWFGRLPQTGCVIEPVPDILAPDAPAAYYYPPAGDGSRPGTYFVNTSRPEVRSRAESASIAFHEAIPGHHLQLAIAMELPDIPDFRRFSLFNTAYAEGWGLYSERLAAEMGLYRDDLDRLGMLAADSLRACRLVVDTGLHALGWDRARAIDFMAANTPTSLEAVTVEVDRYIGMPGQALAYKLGQREILRLRQVARDRLDGGFDIKGFHDAVLGSGGVSLPILAELVDAWIGSQAG